MHNRPTLKLLPVTTLLLAVALATRALGHGTPIHLEQSNSKLVVSGGVADPLGFASRIFVESNFNGDGEELELDPYGEVTLWTVPGFEITGLEDRSLTMEVLLRPVVDATPPPNRTLWFWNPQSQVVEPANSVARLHLLARDDRVVTLTPTDVVAPPPLLLVEDLTDEQNSHNHSLLAYALSNEPTAPNGAYGFFARLTSNGFAPSDPFLIVLNRNVPYAQMLPAALAINAAAKTSVTGDYDGNGHVEPADYDFWKARFGNTVTANTSPDGNGNGIVDAADYTVWRNAFIAAGGGSFQSAALVPEPATGALLLTTLFALVTGRRLRCGPPVHETAHAV